VLFLLLFLNQSQILKDIRILWEHISAELNVAYLNVTL
jgi:hypothetical protein